MTTRQEIGERERGFTCIIYIYNIWRDAERDRRCFFRAQERVGPVQDPAHGYAIAGGDPLAIVAIRSSFGSRGARSIPARHIVLTIVVISIIFTSVALQLTLGNDVRKLRSVSFVAAWLLRSG